MYEWILIFTLYGRLDVQNVANSLENERSDVQNDANTTENERLQWTSKTLQIPWQMWGCPGDSYLFDPHDFLFDSREYVFILMILLIPLPVSDPRWTIRLKVVNPKWFLTMIRYLKWVDPFIGSFFLRLTWVTAIARDSCFFQEAFYPVIRWSMSTYLYTWRHIYTCACTYTK